MLFLQCLILSTYLVEAVYEMKLDKLGKIYVLYLFCSCKYLSM